MPVFAGMALKNVRYASSPPAEAPMPTTRLMAFFAPARGNAARVATEARLVTLRVCRFFFEPAAGMSNLVQNPASASLPVFRRYGSRTCSSVDPLNGVIAQQSSHNPAKAPEALGSYYLDVFCKRKLGSMGAWHVNS